MKDDDIRNLLGGFATGTLTSEERQLLFTAALKDQELFDALADEEALRELLSDPASRRRLLQAIEPGGARLLDRLSDPIRLRRWWALAGGLAVAVVAVIALRQTVPPARQPLQATKEEDRLARVENRPAAEEPAPEVASRNVAAPPRKMKVAVLDFDAGPGKSKDAQAASDLLGKKLDSEGYSVVDRKRVDEALQAQNLVDRPLDAAAAANVGRQVGADAVIVGSVKPAAAPMRAKAAEQVAVTATAINSQTAGNVAYAQGGQQQSAGLAEAVDQVASSLSQQFQQKKALVSVGGLVTEVNEKTLTLNIGASGGMKIGERLEVRRAGKPIGAILIERVQESTSTGVYDGADPARVGDTVTTPGSLSR